MTLQEKIATVKEMAATTGKSFKECMAIVNSTIVVKEVKMTLTDGVKMTDKEWAKFEAKKNTEKAAKAKFDNMTTGEFEDYKEDQKAKSRMSQRPSSLR